MLSHIFTYFHIFILVSLNLSLDSNWYHSRRGTDIQRRLLMSWKNFLDSYQISLASQVKVVLMETLWHKWRFQQIVYVIKNVFILLKVPFTE